MVLRGSIDVYEANKMTPNQYKRKFLTVKENKILKQSAGINHYDISIGIEDFSIHILNKNKYIDKNIVRMDNFIYFKQESFQ
ncbi:MAG: hypothetical protein AABY32_00765 [Nanoarchaeota archaeon]